MSQFQLEKKLLQKRGEFLKVLEDTCHSLTRFAPRKEADAVQAFKDEIVLRLFGQEAKK